MPPADDFNWDDLRYFLRAAQIGTLAGAARSMGVEHSTIGRRLSALERSVGAPLVLRGPDGLTLTPLGERIVPLVHEVERSVLAVRQMVISQCARVRVALPSGFTGLLTDDLARLRKEHPELTLETMGGSRAVDLRRGEADLAVRIGPVVGDDLVVRSLGEIGWSLYASRGYIERHPAPTNPEELAGHDVIAYGADLASLPASVWLETHLDDANVVLRSNEVTTMLAAVVSGAGLAVLPCFIAEAEPTLVRLTQKVLAKRGLSLVYRREVRLAEAVKVASRFIVEVIRKHTQRISGVAGH